MPSALVLLSNGAEEMEAVITIDVLRRGGIEVIVGGVNGSDLVTCSRNVVIKPDIALKDAINTDFDLIVCPGGLKGAENLAQSNVVGDLFRKQEARNALLACICAAPIALKSHGIGKGKTITSYPSFEDELKKAGYNYSNESVVVDGKLVTSRGPGTSFEFALKLVELLTNKEKRDSLVQPMLLKL